MKVNYKSKELHNAALLKAVKKTDVDGVRTALNRGASAKIVDKESKRTVLVAACLEGDPTIIDLLLKAGANPNKPRQEIRMASSENTLMICRIFFSEA